MRYVRSDIRENVPRSFEIYGLGYDESASQFLIIRLQACTVLRGKVVVKSSAAWRCNDAILTAFERFFSSNKPVRGSGKDIDIVLRCRMVRT